MNTEIKYLILKLEESYNGNPWYGDSMMEKLNSIDFKTVNNTSSAITNSVAKLVQHIISWRIYAIKKLLGNKEFDIPINSASDWTKIHMIKKMDWHKLLKNLDQTQIELIEILSSQTDSFLLNPISGKTNDFKFLIEGIIQHDIYHLGQIGLAVKLKLSN